MTTTTKTRRQSYARRTGQDSRGAALLAAAMFKKIETVEDEDGNVMRVWKSFEGGQFTNAQLKACLSKRVAVEANEMLGTVPPAAIKYCVNKGFLVQRGSLYFVTLTAALAHDLPLTFTGTARGRRIPFLKPQA